MTSDDHHVWGSVPGNPHIDGGQCIKCGLFASGAQIARNRHFAILVKCPGWKK